MTEWILERESLFRIGVFAGTLGVMSLWEWLSPRRGRTIRRSRRWPHNLGVVMLDSVIARIIAPAGAVGFALLAEARDWGLFHRAPLPVLLELLLSLVLLDLAIYGQHRLFHRVPFLWRLHRMHHADLDIDVTTGARFHPIEILLSLGIKFLVIALLGAPAVAVLLFEIGLNASSMFNHSNVRIPVFSERLLRWLVVTPDMHRVHHSIDPAETDSNFGFNFPWWDRVFGTYRAEPKAGHREMTIGIQQFRNPRELVLSKMLTQPFRNDKSHEAAP